MALYKLYYLLTYVAKMTELVSAYSVNDLSLTKHQFIRRLVDVEILGSR